jgi:hypothetical protein
MTKREIRLMLVCVLVIGSLGLWGAISAINHYALGDDDEQTVVQDH